MSKPIVYLAGPIDGLTYGQATDWRKELENRLQYVFEVLSPMRDKRELKSTSRLQSPYPYLLCRSDTIVQRDLLDLRRADLLIVNGIVGTVGTAIEVGYAVRAQTPVILIAAPSDPIRGHPFMMRLPGLSIVEDLSEAVLVACSLFNV